MTKKDGKPPETSRNARLAEKLRENLRRRKMQLRGRKEMAANELRRVQDDDTPPAEEEEPG